MGNIDRKIINLKEFNSLDMQRVQEEVVKLLAKNLNKPVNEIKYSSKGNEVMKYYFKGKDHE